MNMLLLLLLAAGAILLPIGLVLLHERNQRRDAARAAAEAQRTQHANAPGQLARRIERAAEELRATTLGLVHERRRQDARAAFCAGLAAKIRAALPDGVWVVAVALIGGGVWALAGTSEVSVDAFGFLGTGYPVQLAWPLALLASLGFSLLGLAFWDLVGATSLLPFAGQLRTPIRRAAAVSTALVLVIATMQLPGLVRHRSEPIAAQVRELEQNLQALRASGADVLAISQMRRQLGAAEDKLQSARYTDQRLAVAAAGTEAATSFAAVWLFLLTGSWTVSAIAARARRKAAEAELQRQRAEGAMRLRLIDEFYAGGYTPEQVQEELDRNNRRPSPPPAVGASPAPTPPGPQGPAAGPGPRPGPRPAPRPQPGPGPRTTDEPPVTSDWRIAL